MKRLTYIYLLLPLYTVLSFAGAAPQMLGVYGAAALGGVLCLAVWALVWLRLYGAGSVRPEFAILSVLPTLCYLALKVAGDEVIAAFSTPAWQNLYFFLWVAAAAIPILSLRSDYRDGPPLKWTHDGALLLTSIFIILYTGWTWTSTASGLFPITH